MADRDVRVTDIKFNNSDLPLWATEATLVKVEQALAKKKGGKDKTDKIAKDTGKKIEKGFQSMSKATKDATATFAKFSAKQINTPFKSFNTGLMNAAKKFPIAGAVVGAFTLVIGTIIGKFKAFSDQFRMLFATGYRFEQGSIGLATAAVRAEMSLGEYTEILGKYSTTVGIVGTRAFSDLNVAMRQSLMEVGLLGMSLGELTEHTADYLEQRQLMGILEGDRVRDLTDQTQVYLKNISAMSTLFNVSRDQIAQVIKSAVTIQAFSNALNQLPESMQENMLKVAQVIGGGFAGLGLQYGNELANTFTTAIGRGGLYFTEAGRMLLAVNKPLYDSMSKLAKVTDSNVAAAGFSDMLEQLKNTTDAERERLMILERSNTQYAAGARQQIDLINRIQQLDEETIGALKDLQKLREAQKPDKMVIAFTRFEIAMQKLRIVFDKFFTTLFGKERILGIIENVMTRISKTAVEMANWLLRNAERFGNAMAGAIESVLNWAEDFQGKSLGEMLIHALTPLFEGLKFIIASGIRMGFEIVKAGLGKAGRVLLGVDNPLTPFLNQEANEFKLKKIKAEEAMKLDGTTSKLNSTLVDHKDELADYEDIAKRKFTSEQDFLDWSKTTGKGKFEGEDKARIISLLRAIEDIPKQIAGAVTSSNKAEENRLLTEIAKGYDKARFQSTFGTDYDFAKSMANKRLILKDNIY